MFGRIVTFAFVALLSGCSVSPSAFTTSNMWESHHEAYRESRQRQVNSSEILTLEMAMARALKNNKERRVALMESSLAIAGKTTASLDMLPSLTVNAGYSNRDRLALSSSGTFEDGVFSPVDPPAYSGAANKEGTSGSATFSWNVLDFGLSYVRANQAADSSLIAQERERKAIQNLIADVRVAYWKASSAQKLKNTVQPLLARVEGAIQSSRQMGADGSQAPLEALDYQKELLELRSSLESLYRDLIAAEYDLKRLIAVSPAEDILLETLVSSGNYEVPSFKVPVDALEKVALVKRPELVELQYQKRISHQQSRAALLGLLPSFNLTYAYNYDDNPFLLYEEWNSWGATVSANLFNVFKAPSRLNQADLGKQLVDARTEATLAAVMAQVHIAYATFNQSVRQFEAATQFADVTERISDQSSALRETASGSEMQVIRDEFESLIAEFRKDVAYADLQNSYGRIFSSVGVDAIVDGPIDNSLEAIADSINRGQQAWTDQSIFGVVLSPIDEHVPDWTGPGAHYFKIDATNYTTSQWVQVELNKSNGSSRPDWLNFEPDSLVISGNPAVGAEGDLELTLKLVSKEGIVINDNFW